MSKKMITNWLCCPFLWILSITNFVPMGVASNSSSEKEDLMRFHLASDERIVDAYGVVIFDPIVKIPGPADSTNEDVQSLVKPESVTKTAQVKELDQGIWEISALLTAEEQDRPGKVTVVAVTDSGKILPGGVRSLKEPSEFVRLQKEQLQCHQRENGVTTKKLLRLNEKALTSLVEVRSAKEEVLRNHLAQLLTPETVDKLSQREKALGLYYAEPISEKLSLTDLASRITAINALGQNSLPSSSAVPAPSLKEDKAAPTPVSPTPKKGSSKN